MARRKSFGQEQHNCMIMKKRRFSTKTDAEGGRKKNGQARGLGHGEERAGEKEVGKKKLAKKKNPGLAPVLDPRKSSRRKRSYPYQGKDDPSTKGVFFFGGGSLKEHHHQRGGALSLRKETILH